eukprot:TRINITY_DN977_c0_g1_i3.p1 TRINITY_DN977_c0_g1~~TRINITY_DN977_c0_g1_i3.p1  ORF type:complete len:554 (-),score=139.76 TRINITY_DN977_c0_g1_i3:492-2153(-)
MTLPDGPMQSLLSHARKYSSEEPTMSNGVGRRPPSSGGEDYELEENNRRPSINYPEGYSLDRRLSEAGVNRRPSASQILTEDTDSFIIGENVYVDGVKKGRIQFIGETKFGPGEWAGVFLVEAMGKNDGAVGSTRYFQCEPRHGVFARLFRLTREPIEGAEEVLGQMRKYGYEILEPPLRRGSIGGSSGGSGSRRGSMCFEDHHAPPIPHHLHHHLHPRRGSTDRGSLSPRQARTPETRRRSSVSRASPDTTGCLMHDPNRRGSLSNGDRRSSLTIPERRGSGAFIPPRSPRGNRVNHGKSPLASPRTSRSNLSISKPIEKDPDVNKLISEARRLSMGGSGRRGSDFCDQIAEEIRRGKIGGRRPSTDISGRRSTSNPRRTSESSSSSSSNRSPNLNRAPRQQSTTEASKFSRKTSESLGLGARRSSSSENNSRAANMRRRPSADLEATELLSRRQSEAGLRRPSASDVVLNEATSNLRVGMPVYVDGTKPGRIAYIGDVHFAQGIMAGIHLDRPVGKNSGSIGGVMYFQCEPKRGVFSKLHRLTTSPMNGAH